MALILTRTLLGAIIFNNCMAVIGFLQNDLTLPISMRMSLAMSFVTLVIVLGLLIMLSQTPRHAAV